MFSTILTLTLSLVFAGMALFGFFMFKYNRFAMKSKAVLDMFRNAETEMKKGIAVYTPKPEEIKLFERMANRGMLKRNPLSTGGYLLSDSFRQLWKDDSHINASDVVHVRTAKDGIKEEIKEMLS